MTSNAIKESILSLDPASDDVIALSSTIDLERGKDCIIVTRYFKLFGNARSWAIQGNRKVGDWNDVMSVVGELKAEIREKRKLIGEYYDTNGLHGMTFYID